MKKIILLLLALCVVVSAADAQNKKRRRKNNQQEVPNLTQTVKLPCFLADTPTEMTATGVATGHVQNLGDLLLKAQDNAKQQLYGKLRSKVVSAWSSYRNSGSSQATPDDNRVEEAIKATIDQFVNEIGTFCQESTNPDGDGKLILYVGIKVPKQAFAVRSAEALDSVFVEMNLDSEQLGVSIYTSIK